MLSVDRAGREEFLRVEAIARGIIFGKLADLQMGLQTENMAILAPAYQETEELVQSFPKEYLDYFVMELIMILAANTTSTTLRLGMGEV